LPSVDEALGAVFCGLCVKIPVLILRHYSLSKQQWCKCTKWSSCVNEP